MNLPSEQDQSPQELILGGKGPNRSILLFDLNGKFPVSKLKRMLLEHLGKRIAEYLRAQEVVDGNDLPDENQKDQIVKGWLEGLIIWRPKDEFQSIAGIELAREEVFRRCPDRKVCELGGVKLIFLKSTFLRLTFFFHPKILLQP